MPPPGRIAIIDYAEDGTLGPMTVRTETLPREAMRMGALLLPSGDEIVLAYGVYETSDRPNQDAIYRIDAETFEATQVMVPDEQNRPSDGPILVYDDATRRVWIWDGFTWDADGRAIRRYALDLVTSLFTLDFGFGDQLVPRATTMLLGADANDVLLFPATSLRAGTFGDLWTYDLTSGAMSRTRIQPDAANGDEPTEFGGNDFDVQLRTGLFGMLTYNFLDAWSVVSNGSGGYAWVHHDVAVPQSERYFLTVWEDGCGQDFAVHDVDAFLSLDCNFTGHSCTWSAESTAVTSVVSGRMQVGAANAGGYVTYLFGGREGLDVKNDVFRRPRSGSNCNAQFQPVAPTGTPPDEIQKPKIAWDGEHNRFFLVLSGTSWLWTLEFGAGDPNSSTPAWRVIDGEEVEGIWPSSPSNSRIYWTAGRLLLLEPSGALYAFYPED